MVNDLNTTEPFNLQQKKQTGTAECEECLRPNWLPIRIKCYLLLLYKIKKHL